MRGNGCGARRTRKSQMIDKIPMTAEGYAALVTELKHCREVERPRIQQMGDARTPEDLSEMWNIATP
jgi:transcription elongation factor GreA